MTLEEDDKPLDRHEQGYDYDISDVARLATDIHSLTEVQELFVWQRTYAFQASRRSAALKEANPALDILYRKTHGREVSFMIEGQFMPFAHEEPNEGPAYLVAQSQQPLLSIVLTTRNDTHVERMEDRTQAFLDMVYHLAEVNETPTEVLIVEWNPPEERASMAEGFDYIEDHPFVTVRILTVPVSIHKRYRWSDSLPLYQMIAKNAGVRRARGAFIAVTNVDILLSQQLWSEITDPDLPKGAIYRSDRHDVDRSILDVDGAEEQLLEAEPMTFQYNYREGIVQRGEPRPSLIDVEDLSPLRYENTNLYRLHTEACGDFQMLHRDDWAKVRGYSELDAYSFHLDSLFAVTCFHASLDEVVLKGPHYHIDHTLGVKVKSDSYEINERKVIKHLSLTELCILDKLQKDHNDFFLTNRQDWGLAGDTLEESLPSQADWDQGVQFVDNPFAANGDATPSSYPTLQDINKLSTVDLKVDVFLRAAWQSTIDYITRHADNRPVKIWGAGRRGELTFEALKSLGLEVDGFIHGGAGDLPSGMPKPVQRAAEYWENSDEKAFILISSMHAEAILKGLEEKGYREGADFIVCL